MTPPRLFVREPALEVPCDPHESFGLETYSPYQDRDLRDARIMDSGDLELPFGDTEKCFARSRSGQQKSWSDGKRPFLLGGEHLVTLGAFRAALKKYPELCMIHFDAHTDLREDYLGVKLSHACVIRRCWELVGDGRILQFGIRSGEREEFLWAKDIQIFMRLTLKGLERSWRL